MKKKVYTLKQDYNNKFKRKGELYFVIEGEYSISLKSFIFYNKKHSTIIIDLYDYVDFDVEKLSKFREVIESAHLLLKDSGKLLIIGDDKRHHMVLDIINEIFGKNNYLPNDTVVRLQSQSPKGSLSTHNSYFDNKLTIKYFCKNINRFEGFGDIMEWSEFGAFKSGSMVEGSKGSLNEIMSDKHFPVLVSLIDNDINKIKSYEYKKLISIKDFESRKDYLHKLVMKYSKEGYVVSLPYESNTPKHWRFSYEDLGELLKLSRKYFKRNVSNKSYLSGVDKLLWFNSDEDIEKNNGFGYTIGRYYVRDGFFKRYKNSIRYDASFLKKEAFKNSIPNLRMSCISDSLANEILMYNSPNGRSDILVIGDVHNSLLKKCIELNKYEYFDIKLNSFVREFHSSNLESVDSVIKFNSYIHELDKFDEEGYVRVLNVLEELSNFFLINNNIFMQRDLGLSSQSYSFYKISDVEYTAVYFDFDNGNLLEYIKKVEELSKLYRVNSLVVNSNNEDYFEYNENVFTIFSSERINRIIESVTN
jgi:hypothetical protein